MEEKQLVERVSNKVFALRNAQVIIDRDVAELYGVTTRDINKAVKNNPDKFPHDYVIELTSSEKEEVVENFHHLQALKYSHVPPKAFTEKGLYMLATIIKSQLATETTIAIIETFAKLRELSRSIELANEKGVAPDEGKFQRLMKEVLTDPLPVKMRKTAFSVNLGVLKISIETTREEKSSQ